MTFLQLYGKHRNIHILMKDGTTYTGSLEGEDSASIVLCLLGSHTLKRIYADDIKDHASA